MIFSELNSQEKEFNFKGGGGSEWFLNSNFTWEET